MAIERMSVVNTGKGFVHLRARNQEHCKQCEAGAGCGIQLLNKAMPRSADIIAVEIPQTQSEKYRPGDEMLVDIDDGKLIGMCLLQYFFPILLLVLATALAQSLVAHYELNETGVILTAFLALAGGMTLVRYLSLPLISPAGKMFKTGTTEVAYIPTIQATKNQD